MTTGKDDTAGAQRDPLLERVIEHTIFASR